MEGLMERANGEDGWLAGWMDVEANVECMSGCDM